MGHKIPKKPMEKVMIWTGRNVWLNSIASKIPIAIFAAHLASLAPALAQLEKPQETPNTQLPVGAEQITEGRVTATISFLASDELSGRETNSKEFEIAAAYVAARFRGAGLEGGGPEGSFYHETLVSQSRVPSDAVLLQADSVPIAHYGLLTTGDKPCELQGPVMDVSLEALQAPEADFKGLRGIVRGKFETQAKGSRAVGQLNRLAQKLEAAGVEALLLDCDPQSEWIKQAELARTKPKLQRGDRVGIPILLVPSAVRIAGDVKLTGSAMINDDKRMRNVIGLLRGSDETLQKQAILYSAHLDHLGSNPTLVDDQVFNGADDDASGVTAVVTLADAIGAMKQRPKRSVLFMTFWGEESGLLGSKQFVATPSWQLDQIVANINIEMIGRPEGGARGKIWMTGWQESDLGMLMSQSAKPWGVEIFEHPKFSSMLYRASDNWSFVERGVIAHSFSAGSLHPDYHQVDDEWDRLEIPHMTQVIQGLWLGSLPLLEGTQTPNKSTVTKKESK
jgi:hypothetical protein